ncbi:MAG: flagellar biosynthetic protein FliR [Treponema sp.]|nr:flagellar biosynthetic protein FliR [Treponema sp.]
MLNTIVQNAPVFLLILARCFAMIMTLPLLSMRSVPKMAKLALAFYVSYIVFPQVNFSVYLPYIMTDNSFSLIYLLLVIGEAMIGVIIGFYVSIIFAAFSTAGQFFAFQMGFSASEVYDSMAQVENPLMGQYLTFIAMLIFIQNHWFQTLFLKALLASYKSLTAFSIAVGREKVIKFLLSGLTDLFSDALIIALPLIGTLCLITVCTGILSKAAPQMNLLSEGFPIMMLTAFFILTALMPELCDFFMRAFNTGFGKLEHFMADLSGGGI